MSEKLKWKRNTDPDDIKGWSADIAPVHLIVYDDFDWYSCVRLQDVDGAGHATQNARGVPKTLAQAKRQCEAAARKLVKVREYWEGLK